MNWKKIISLNKINSFNLLEKKIIISLFIRKEREEYYIEFIDKMLIKKS